jgi:hypothetical protein
MHKAKAQLARLRGLERKKFLFASTIIVAFALAVVGVTLVLVNTFQTQQVALDGTKVVISGEVACLPHKDTSGPQTLECALGLHSDDNRYYALKDAPSSVNSDVGQRIEVHGTLSTANSSIYDIAGTITVTQLTR